MEENLQKVSTDSKSNQVFKGKNFFQKKIFKIIKKNKLILLVTLVFFAVSAISVSAFFLLKKNSKNEFYKPLLAFSKQKEEEMGVKTIGNQFEIISPEKVDLSGLKKEQIKIQPEIDFDLNISADKVTIIPKNELEKGTIYQVSIAKGANLNKIKTTENYEWKFQTVPKFDVTGITPKHGSIDAPANTAIEIEFNYRNVDIEEFKKYFSIEPAVAGRFEHKEKKIVFLPEKMLNANYDYKVTIKKGFGSDEFGRIDEDKISEFRVKKDFFIQANSPESYIPSDIYVKDKNAISSFYKNPKVFLATTGITKDITVKIYSANIAALQESYSSISYFGNINRPSDSNLQKVKDEILKVKKYQETYDLSLNYLKTGLYFIEVISPDFIQPQYLYIMNSEKGISIISGNQIVGHVFDLRNAKLLGNQKVKIFNGKSFIDTTTNDSGKFTGEAKDFKFIAVVENDKVVAALSYNFNLYQPPFRGENYYYDQYYSSEEFRTLVYTDRKLYKAGDVVNFKTVIRKDDDMLFSIPQDFEVTARLIDRNENYTYMPSAPIYEEKIKLSSDFGSASSSFLLPANLKSGNKLLEIQYKDEVIGSTYIEVAEFLKPKFEATVTVEKLDQFIGEKAVFNSFVKYYSGQPAANIDAEIKIYCGYAYEPNWATDLSYLPKTGSYYDGEVVLSKKVKTDANGKVRYEVIGSDCKSKAKSNSNTIYYTFEIILQSGGDLTTIASANTFFHKTKNNVFAQVIGISNENGLYVKENENKSVKFKVVNSISFSPIPNLPIYIMGYRNYYNKIQTGTRYNEYTKTVEPVYTNDYQNETVLSAPFTTDQNGEVVVQLNNLKWGTYYFGISEDKTKSDKNEGPERSLNNLFYVEKTKTKEELVQENLYTEKVFVTVNLDKENYRIGEKANVLIKSAIDSDAVLTLYRGNVYSDQKIVLSKNKSQSFSFDIDEKFFPITYVRVTFISSQPYNTNLGADDRCINFAYSFINIDSAYKKLQIEVIPDKKNYEPNDEAIINVIVKDSKGNPLKSEVSLAIIDKAIMSLSSFDYKDSNGNYIDNVFNFFTLAKKFAWTNVSHPVEYIGDTVGGAGEPDSRKEFPDTAYWNAFVKTGEDGKAQVKVKVPGSLTTWVIGSVAITADGKGSSTYSEFSVSKEKYADFNLPVFIREGDKAIISSRIVNGSKNKASFEILAEGKGLSVTNLSASSVSLNPGEIKEVTFSISPDTLKQIGEVKFAIKENGKIIDESVKSTRIIKLGSVVATTTGKLLTSSNLSEMKLNINDTARTSLKLYLSNSLVPVDAIQSAEISTNSTVELANSIIKNSTLYKFYDELKPEESKESIKNKVSYALNILRANQDQSGGLGWFSYDAVNTETSAFGLLAVSIAKKNGFEIGNEFEQKLVKYLKGQLLLESVSYDEKTLIIYAISESGDNSVLPAALFALKNISQFEDSPQALTYLAVALKNLEDKGDGEFVISKLKKIATVSDRLAFWQDNDAPFKALKNDQMLTALAYLALKGLSDGSEISLKAENYLVENPIDMYSNKLASVFSFYSLVICNSDKLNDKDVDVKIFVNGKEVSNNKVGKAGLLVSINSNDLVNGENTVKVEKNGKMVYVKAVSESFVESVDPKAEFKMSVKFINLLTGKEQTSFKRGDFVKVRTEIVTDREGYNLKVFNFMPAGFTPVQFRIEGLSIAVREQWWSWSKEMINKFGEFTSDYAEFNTHQFNKGETLKYEFLVEASFSGEYNTNGSKSFLQSSPDIGGEVVNGKVVIN